MSTRAWWMIAAIAMALSAPVAAAEDSLAEDGKSPPRNPDTESSASMTVDGPDPGSSCRPYCLSG